MTDFFQYIIHYNICPVLPPHGMHKSMNFFFPLQRYGYFSCKTVTNEPHHQFIFVEDWSDVVLLRNSRLITNVCCDPILHLRREINGVRGQRMRPQEPSTEQSDIDAICHNAVETDFDIGCKPGTILWAVNTTDTSSCHRCVEPGSDRCPAQTTGSGCTLCQDVSVCEDLTLRNGTVLSPQACSMASIEPIELHDSFGT